MHASRSTYCILHNAPSGSPADLEGPVTLRPRITSGLPLSEVQLNIIGSESSTVNDLQVFGSRSFQVASSGARTAARAGGSWGPPRPVRISPVEPQDIRDT
jgi:hypothetical protein